MGKRIHQMIVGLPVPEYFELAILDDVGVGGVLTLRHDDLIVLTLHELRLLRQLLDLVVGKAVEERHFTEEVELAIILLYFDLLEHPNVIAAIENGDLGRLRGYHGLFSLRCFEVVDLKCVLAKACAIFVYLLFNPPFEEAERFYLDQVLPLDLRELDEALTVELVLFLRLCVVFSLAHLVVRLPEAHDLGALFFPLLLELVARLLLLLFLLNLLA